MSATLRRVEEEAGESADDSGVDDDMCDRGSQLLATGCSWEPARPEAKAKGGARGFEGQRSKTRALLEATVLCGHQGVPARQSEELLLPQKVGMVQCWRQLSGSLPGASELQLGAIAISARGKTSKAEASGGSRRARHW